MRLEDPEEADFLLVQDQKNSEENALKFLKLYPKSSHIPEALHFLGGLALEQGHYKKAIFYFKKAAANYPHYYALDELLSLQAEALDHIPNESEKARLVRKELIQNFPDSPFAEDASFRTFPEKEYLLATPHAITHLKAFVQNYPRAFFAIPAHFYIGAFLKQESAKLPKEQKTLSLKQALTEFYQADTLYKELKCPNH